ncbi:hypothetical protein LXL04_006514 [Taraxacum kok-saghyz]
MESVKLKPSNPINLATTPDDGLLLLPGSTALLEFCLLSNDNLGTSLTFKVDFNFDSLSSHENLDFSFARFVSFLSYSMDFWRTSIGLGESTCFNSFCTFLSDVATWIVLVIIEFFTTSLIWFLCKYGDVGSEGSCNNSIVCPLLLQSKDEKIVEEEDEEHEFLGDSMDARVWVWMWLDLHCHVDGVSSLALSCEACQLLRIKCMWIRIRGGSNENKLLKQENENKSEPLIFHAEKYHI